MGAVGGDCVSVIICQDWVDSGLWPGGGGVAGGGGGREAEGTVSVSSVGTGWGGVRGDCVWGERDCLGLVRETLG